MQACNELILHTFTAGVRDGQGFSLVDIIFRNLHEFGEDFSDEFNTALYLINRGCGDKAKLLCEACKWGNLDMVKQLVEQHNVDPDGKYYLPPS